MKLWRLLKTQNSNLIKTKEQCLKGQQKFKKCVEKWKNGGLQSIYIVRRIGTVDENFQNLTWKLRRVTSNRVQYKNILRSNRIDEFLNLKHHAIDLHNKFKSR